MIDVITYAILKSHMGKGSGGGADGKSAYEIAVSNGFEGTEVEWLESLKGKSATISIGDDGHWYINDEDTGVSATGEDSHIPIPDDKIHELFD